jgi:D-alanyl-D-alanine carboxypeptidase (penicillin-binding protein 5/6)
MVALAAAWLTLGAGALSFPLPAVAQGEGPPDLDAKSWILLDARDGHRLAAQGPARERAIASTTKLMTTYLALAELSPRQRLTVPPYSAAAAESVAGLQEGERLSVRDLLRAMLLPSANDAAETVALGIAPSEAQFVDRMNEAAGELGLDRTSYANPIGLDDPLNYSTAADLATLSLKLLEDPRFRDIVGRTSATLKSGSVEREVVNTNTLLEADPSVDGVKTGHTLRAGYVLVASAERHGIPLLSVVLGAPSETERDAASEELLDYGYSLYGRRSPFRADEQLADAVVRYEDEPLELIARRGFSIQARSDQQLDVRVDAPKLVEGPIASGAAVGSATVTLDGELVGRVPLVAARAVAEPGLIDKIGGTGVAVAVLGALFVILLLAALALRRRRGKAFERERSMEERMRSRRERTLKRQEDRGDRE